MAQSVTINGVVFDSVGVKYKGNSTYNPNQTSTSCYQVELSFKSRFCCGVYREEKKLTWHVLTKEEQREKRKKERSEKRAAHKRKVSPLSRRQKVIAQ